MNVDPGKQGSTNADGVSATPDAGESALSTPSDVASGDADQLGRASRRRWPWVVAGVLVLAIAAGVGGWLLYQQQLEEAARVEAMREAVSESNDILDEMWDEMRYRDTSWAAVDADEQAWNQDSLVGLTIADAEEWRADLARVRTLMEEVDDSAVASAYVGAADAYDEVFEETVGELAPSKSLAAERHKIDEGYALLEEGWELGGVCIDNCNADKYTQAMKDAQAAEAKYTGAKTLFGEVAGLIDDPELKNVIAYAQEHVVLAEMKHRLAELGKQGSVNGYNKQIDKMEEQEAEIAFHPGSAYDFDAGWDAVAVVGGTLCSRAEWAHSLAKEASDAAEASLAAR